METSNKKKLQGTVVGDKTEKTCYVLVERVVRHKQYEKMIGKRKKYAVHDEEKSALVGDFVEIIECRPISKTKKFRLGGIIRKAKADSAK